MIFEFPLYMLEYSKYKFKELGYLVLYWWYQEQNAIKNWHGFITPEDLKERIGENQYAKLCQGKRTFIIQRRKDGKNVSLPKNISIEYLDASNSFRLTKKEFSTIGEAEIWEKENLPNFHFDMIKFNKP